MGYFDYEIYWFFIKHHWEIDRRYFKTLPHIYDDMNSDLIELLRSFWLLVFHRKMPLYDTIEMATSAVFKYTTIFFKFGEQDLNFKSYDYLYDKYHVKFYMIGYCLYLKENYSICIDNKGIIYTIDRHDNVTIYKSLLLGGIYNLIFSFEKDSSSVKLPLAQYLDNPPKNWYPHDVTDVFLFIGIPLKVKNHLIELGWTYDRQVEVPDFLDKFPCKVQKFVSQISGLKLKGFDFDSDDVELTWFTDAVNYEALDAESYENIKAIINDDFLLISHTQLNGIDLYLLIDARGRLFQKRGDDLIIIGGRFYECIESLLFTKGGNYLIDSKNKKLYSFYPYSDPDFAFFAETDFYL